MIHSTPDDAQSNIQIQLTSSLVHNGTVQWFCPHSPLEDRVWTRENSIHQNVGDLGSFAPSKGERDIQYKPQLLSSEFLSSVLLDFCCEWFFLIRVTGGPIGMASQFFPYRWFFVKRPNFHLDVWLVAGKRPEVGTHLWVTLTRVSMMAVISEGGPSAFPQKTPAQQQLPCQAMVLNVRQRMCTQRKNIHALCWLGFMEDGNT